MAHFRFSIIFTVICLGLAVWWGFNGGGLAGALSAFLLVGILAIMEVSLSFDNAVVNASVLKYWDEFWKTLFLTVGILIAVFGMRLLFPLLIVGVTADMSLGDVARLALNNPEEYSSKLMEHHAEIAAFGGMFLLLVFLNFVFDQDKDVHWFGWLEETLSKLGKVDAVAIFVALIALLTSVALLPEAKQFVVLMAGVWGILTYVGVSVLSNLLAGNDDDGEELGKAVQRGGIAGFLYLEVLDASFSFDGVIGAFAITSDVIIIMLGLAIGAMFVRSMTIYLVDKGTLDAYIYLEHGAHYAIAALAVIMLISMQYHVPELITGLIGVAFIVWAVFASIKHNKLNPA
ncbi:MAG: DUF475 domain-containing protein [Pseudomonadota bacterium]|nr:DUF475 domain-containing protein [Pseudomonadota bacterium]